MAKTPEIWKVIGLAMNRNSNPRTMPKKITVEVNGRDTDYTDSKYIAMLFLEHFSKNNFFTGHASCHSPLRNINHNTSSFFLNPVTTSEIRRCVHGISTSSSPGHDITCKLIREHIDFFVEPLVFIVNLSFESGIFPEQLKIAKVIPVFKNGIHSDTNNYRPICSSHLLQDLSESYPL